MKMWHLIAVSVLLCVLGITCSIVSREGNREQAEEAAKSFAESLYPGLRPVRVVCQNVDTDNNGYVSCTLVVGEQSPQAIECASKFNLSFVSGCRISRMTLRPE